VTAGAHAEALRARLVAAWTRVRDERMAGVPILNDAIGVDALAPRPWRDGWLTVLVTPWSINFMLLPDVGADWSSLRPGQNLRHVFPAGAFSFIVGDEPGYGRYQMCSLFSPVLEFEGHDAAMIAAAAALDALFRPDDAEQDRPPSDESFMYGLAAGRPRAEREQAAPDQERVATRREFLTRGLPGSKS